MMIPNDHEPMPDCGCEVSPEFLRQMPEQALLVPRVLDAVEGGCSLHLAGNGRGDNYSLLRIQAPSDKARKGGEFFHYVGKLDDVQLQFVDRLVAEHRAERVPSGPEQLKDAQPLIRDILGLWRKARQLADYAASKAGFTLRGYTLHRRKSPPTGAMPPPPDLGLDSAKYNSDMVPNRLLHESLATCLSEAESAPLCALDRALTFLAALCLWIDAVLDMPLQYSIFECVTAALHYGKCRPFTKRERRAMTMLRKTRAIHEAINKSRERIAPELDAGRTGQ